MEETSDTKTSLTVSAATPTNGPASYRKRLEKRAEYKRFKKEAKDLPLEMYDRRQAALNGHFGVFEDNSCLTT